MYLNNPINQDTPHPLCNLWLVVHILMRWLIKHFSMHEVPQDVGSELNHILRIAFLFLVTFIHGLLHMHLHSPLELVMNRLHLFLEPFALLLFIFLLSFHSRRSAA